MKESKLTFAEGFLGIEAKAAKAQGETPKAFDWDKAALIIKEQLINHPDLVAEAGLQGDWEFTGGVIFKNGKPTNDDYTYLASIWAIPTLILSIDGNEQEIDCFVEENERFTSNSKWDEKSLEILGIELEN